MIASAQGLWLGVIGAGGQAREAMMTARLLTQDGGPLSGVRLTFVDRAPGASLDGGAVVGEKEFFAASQRRAFVVAVGDGQLRRKLWSRAEAAGCKAISLVDPAARVSPHAQLGPGALIGPFAYIGPGVRVGSGLLANYYSQLSHDGVVGDFVTLGPRASINGHVVIDEDVVVGAGAIVRNGDHERPLRLGKAAVIGMGAVVVGNVDAGAVVAGVPARAMVDR